MSNPITQLIETKLDRLSNAVIQRLNFFLNNAQIEQSQAMSDLTEQLQSLPTDSEQLINNLVEQLQQQQTQINNLANVLTQQSKLIEGLNNQIARLATV